MARADIKSALAILFSGWRAEAGGIIILHKHKHVKIQQKSNKKRYIWLSVLSTLLVAAVVVIFWRVSTAGETPDSEVLKAAIVDQLSTTYPNDNFNNEVTAMLKSYGFQVDVYQGNQVTVSFYQNLPSRGYKLIILRTHSGMMQSPQSSQQAVSLFTNEPFNPLKHLLEQLNHQLMKVQVDDNSPLLFGIPPNFITENVKGNFDNAVVIVSGCSGLYEDNLAQAFVQKGASAFLSWDGSVNLDYVDNATIDLVKNLTSSDSSLEKAVSDTMAAIGPDPAFKSYLKYFPTDAGNLPLKDLIH
jgi:hypothetical protein